jgi:hypothetical protein
MHLAALVVALLAVVQGNSDMQGKLFAGTWTANLAKSRLAPGSDFRSVTLEITIAGDAMTMASEIVNTAGRTQRAAETFRTDGTGTAGTLNPGVILMAKWLKNRGGRRDRRESCTKDSLRAPRYSAVSALML